MGQQSDREMLVKKWLEGPQKGEEGSCRDLGEYRRKGEMKGETENQCIRGISRVHLVNQNPTDK